MKEIINAKITETGKKRNLLYIPAEYRYLISTDSNSNINVLINGEYVSRTYDEYFRIMGLSDWYKSHVTNINDPVIIIKSKEGYEIKIVPKHYTKLKLGELRKTLKEIFKDVENKTLITYNEIEVNWKFYNTSKITFDELLEYVNLRKSIRIKFFKVGAHPLGLIKNPLKYKNILIGISTNALSIALTLILKFFF